MGPQSMKIIVGHRITDELDYYGVNLKSPFYYIAIEGYYFFYPARGSEEN